MISLGNGGTISIYDGCVVIVFIYIVSVSEYSAAVPTMVTKPAASYIWNVVVASISSGSSSGSAVGWN